MKGEGREKMGEGVERERNQLTFYKCLSEVKLLFKIFENVSSKKKNFTKWIHVHKAKCLFLLFLSFSLSLTRYP